MAKKQKHKRTRAKKKEMLAKQPPVFGEVNYKFMGGGGGLIFAGFALMAMFNTIDGFVPLYISPILVVAGFVVFGYGIIKKNPALEPAQNPD